MCKEKTYIEDSNIKTNMMSDSMRRRPRRLTLLPDRCLNPALEFPTNKTNEQSNTNIFAQTIATYDSNEGLTRGSKSK